MDAHLPTLPWIDTHCHLDAAEFDADRDEVIEDAARAGVAHIVVPAVDTANFDAVRRLAQRMPGGRYALGIHPLASPGAKEAELELLDAALTRAATDARLVAIGEIGLDLFVDELKSDAARAHQEWLFAEQLRLARHHHLPVLLHVRRAQDRVLKALRAHRGVTGIAHAFNGSAQQAGFFVELGFKLGMGGAMTFERALNIRRIASDMPLDALVLETDAPDIAPAWRYKSRNVPAEIPAIGCELAKLRGIAPEVVAAQTAKNAQTILPRL
jgi:TatD DNase family protein